MGLDKLCGCSELLTHQILTGFINLTAFESEKVRISYHMKIINPEKNIREMHSYLNKFESVGVKMMEKFGEHVPKTLEFNVGYFSSRKCANLLNHVKYCCGAMHGEPAVETKER